MNNTPAQRSTNGRTLATRACAATIGALFALSVAIVSCSSNSGNSDGITRANISDLPTPTGGEIFASADETAATPSTDDVPPDGALFEGADGFEGTIIEGVVADNPEIAALIQKVQDGTATDADIERLDTLLSEAFAADGPAAGLFGFAARPTIGSIEAVNDNSIDIQPAQDEQGITGQRTTITFNDETQIIVASEAALTDVEVNADVYVIAIRGDDGIIRARTVTIADIDDAMFGPDGPDIDGIPAQGRVTRIEDARLHIETEQGPLRVTIDDQTEFVRMASGSASDITQGLAAFTLADPDGLAIMLMVGPDRILDVQGIGFDIPVP